MHLFNSLTLIFTPSFLCSKIPNFPWAIQGDDKNSHEIIHAIAFIGDRLFISGTYTRKEDASALKHPFVAEHSADSGSKVFSHSFRTTKGETVLIDMVSHPDSNTLYACGYLKPGSSVDFGNGYTLDNSESQNYAAYVSAFKVEGSSLNTLWAKKSFPGTVSSKCYDITVVDNSDVVAVGTACKTSSTACNGAVEKYATSSGIPEIISTIFDPEASMFYGLVFAGQSFLMTGIQSENKGALLSSFSKNTLKKEQQALLGSPGDSGFAIDARIIDSETTHVAIAGSINAQFSTFDDQIITNGGFVAKFSLPAAGGFSLEWIASAGTNAREVLFSSDGQSLFLQGMYDKPVIFSNGNIAFTLPLIGAPMDIFVAKYNTHTGHGDYVLDAGGHGTTYPWAMAKDTRDNVYLGGMFKGHLTFGSLRKGLAANDYNFYLARLDNSAPTCPTCLNCHDKAGSSTTCSVKANMCFINNRCFADGESSPYYQQQCYTCNSTYSKTQWQADSSESYCLIGNVCYKNGDGKNPSSYHSSGGKAEKEDPEHCLTCETAQHRGAFSTKPGYELKENTCVLSSTSGSSGGTGGHGGGNDDGVDAWMVALIATLVFIVALLAASTFFVYGLKKPSSKIGHVVLKMQTSKDVSRRGVRTKDEDCHELSGDIRHVTVV